MQRGTIRWESGGWFLYYREAGRKQCRRLGAGPKDRTTPPEIRALADRILEPVNLRQRAPEALMPLREFIENHYQPEMRRKLRPSTAWDYGKIFKLHLLPRIGERVRLCDFTTPQAQDILDDIHEARPQLTHQRMLRIRAALSAVFAFALRKGILVAANPVHATVAPGRRTKFRGSVYSLEEIFSQLDALRKEPYGLIRALIVATAAFSGLRASELRGLKWRDYDGETLNVSRSVWRTHVGATKTPEAEDAVPVLPLLKNLLDWFRSEVTGSDDDYIFRGPRRGRPLNLHNFARRYLIPVFEKAKPPLEWKGWHAYRRSLASTLYGLDVPPKVIARILRHSSIATTMNYYVQTEEKESKVALDKIQRKIWALHKASKRRASKRP